MKRSNPLLALSLGLVSGAIGSGAQSLFFKWSAPLAPKPSPDAFDPPEPQQKNEMATETIARRWVELFMKRGLLTEDSKKNGAQIVHYLFGSGWGGLYGLTQESFPEFPLLAHWAIFSTGVWMLSENLIMPSFKVAGWPNRYPLKTHLYAWIAHLVYGGAVVGAYYSLQALVSEEELGQIELTEQQKQLRAA